MNRMKGYRLERFPHFQRHVSVANHIRIGAPNGKHPMYHRIPISIVYFANLFVNPNGLELVRLQMADMLKCGLLNLQGACMHIVLSVPPSQDKHASLVRTIKSWFQPGHKVMIDLCEENCHEYPGISKIYQLATASPEQDHYLLYYHSKGISRFDGVHREANEVKLQRVVVDDWKWIVYILHNLRFVEKVGSSMSSCGWIWWNYWWMRASYVSRVEKPLKTERRHYYEDWACRQLKRGCNGSNMSELPINSDAYNLQTNNGFCLSAHLPEFFNIGTTGEAGTACHLLMC